MSLDDFTPVQVNCRMGIFSKCHPARACCARTSFAVIFAIGLFTAGCRHLPTPPPDAGTSSFAFVDPPPVPPRKATMAEPSNGPILEEHYVEAEPIPPLATPVYPAHALAAHAGLVTIGVKISVDIDGRVSHVSPSLLTFSTPTRYSEEFEEAVRVAVMRWRFNPAQRYTLRIFRTEEGGGPPREIHRENTETYFDLAFTFTASGTVLSGSAGK